jgi:long-chain fatty acid transport protein
MKLRKRILTIIFLTIHYSLFTIHCFAGGFQINTQGAKALGMGGSFVGLDNDASCIFFNPAGMSDLKNRHEIYVGASFIFPQVSVQTPAVSNTNQNSPVATPIELYYVFKCTDKLSFGLGINNQFGAKSSYPNDWEGRYIVQELSLKTYMFQPTVSYKINDYINVGAGFVYSTGSFDLMQAAPLESNSYPYGEAHLTGTGNSTGYNVGILSHVEDYFTIGISYRSKFKLNLNNGSADFTDIPNAAANMYPPSTTFSSSVTLPAVLCFGISKEFMDGKFAITFDFWRTFWSSYDTLKFTFADTSTPSVVSPRLYKDVNYFALGGYYQIKKKLIVRAGIFYDFSPIQEGYVSPELPDANTFGWSLGVSYKLNNTYSFDLSFLNYDDTMTRSYTQEGFTATYHKIVSVIDVGINFSFGKKFPKKGEVEE